MRGDRDGLPAPRAYVACRDRSRFAQWYCFDYRHCVRTTACSSHRRHRYVTVRCDVRFRRAITAGWSGSPGTRKTNAQPVPGGPFYGAQRRRLAGRGWGLEECWWPSGARNDSRPNPARESSDCVTRHDWRPNMDRGTARQGSEHLWSNCSDALVHDAAGRADAFPSTRHASIKRSPVGPKVLRRLFDDRHEAISL